MSKNLQGWSLEDVLGILFAEEEAKFIVQSMRENNSEYIPENAFKNKAIKDQVINGFSHLAENYYGGKLGDDYFPSTPLDIRLNPLIVTRWLKDSVIFDNLFFCQPLPEGANEKITSLRESIAKDFDSIDLKEFSKADYWSETEFHILLFGGARADIYFPELLRQFPVRLNQEIIRIEKYLIGAIERGRLDRLSSSVKPIIAECYLFDDDGGRYDPTQLLSILQSKQYPVPNLLIEFLKEQKYAQAAEQLKILRSNMRQLIESASTSPGDKLENLDKFVGELRVWCVNDIEINIQKPGQKPFVANSDILGFQNVKTKEWLTLISVLKSNNNAIYYDKSMQDKKQIFLSIEKKLLNALNKILSVEFPKGFKLIESIPSRPGERRFKFRVTSNPEKVVQDYSGCDKNQILALLKEHAHQNAHPDDYANVVRHAEELGISEEDIRKVIVNSQAIQDETDYGSVVDPFENQPNEGESDQY
jgi:hypothetical protein